MSDVSKEYDGQIDLFKVLEILWEGKWKILLTTFAAAVIGLAINNSLVPSVEVSTSFLGGKQSHFFQYKKLNALLNENDMSFSVDQSSVIQQFVSEFGDYKEMVEALSASEHVQNQLRKLGEADKQAALIALARSFEVVLQPGGDNLRGILSFKWHDEAEGKRLFVSALQKTLTNVKNSIKTDINEVAAAVETANLVVLDQIRRELAAAYVSQMAKDERQIAYLREQSTIAKELGIEIVKFNRETLKLNSLSERIIPVNTYDYLRGYKAIDKEISLIQDRSDENRRLFSSDYLKLNTELNILETQNELAVKFFRAQSDLVNSVDQGKWIQYDFDLAHTKTLHKPSLYMALSICFGGLLGTMYVLFLHAFRERNKPSTEF